MKRLLIVSPLDVLGSPNSRTHHLVRHLSAHFQQTIAISRTKVTHKSLRYKLTALLRIRTEVSTEGRIRWVGMTPWGSIREGLGLSVLRLTNPYSVPKWGLRRILRRVFSFLGAIFELGVLPSLIFTFFTRVRGRVDVFIGEGPWEVALGLLLRVFGRTRLVVYDDIDYAPGFQPISVFRQKMIAALERFTIRHADLVISVGNRLAHLRHKQGAQVVHVIPNGVDRDKFMVASQKRREKNQRHPTLIYMGYLGAWAGVEIILDASTLMSKWIKNLRVILVGHGSPEDLFALHDRIIFLGLKEIVELRGGVSYGELPNYLAEADIGLAMFRPLDLTRYAFPLKVIEYMAAGLPVLTTVDTEAADLVIQSGVGVAVPFEAMAVANAVIQILNDTEKYSQYSRNALNLCKTYDWNEIMLKAYEIIERSYKEVSKRTELRNRGS